MIRRAAACALALAALACARPGSPRGGPPDRRPPDVIATEPAPNARIEALPDAVVRFRFSERISENPSEGTMDDAVLVSPATGAVRVDHGRDRLEVRVEGGLRPGLVYRVTLLPVIADLFGNTMRDPFELVFSTGAPLVATVVAGQVLDRVTGRPVPDLVVQLIPRAPQADTMPYLSRTDEAGLYFFRYVPLGPHNVLAFADQNRNAARDPRETWGERGVLIGVDTLFADLTVLAPDSTAATLVRAEVADSTTLRLVFSDYLDPLSTSQAAVALAREDGGAAPPVVEVLHPADHEARADSAAAGPGGAPGASLAVPGQERGGLTPGLHLPRQELIVLLGAPLEVDVPYRITATGVVNVNQLPFGRGDTVIVRRAPARPAGAAAPDSASAAAPASGGALPADSMGASAPASVPAPAGAPAPVPDSVPAPVPDTAAVALRAPVSCARGAAAFGVHVLAFGAAYGGASSSGRRAGSLRPAWDSRRRLAIGRRP